MRSSWKHSIVEEAKGECSATLAGAPLGYFEERLRALVAQGHTSCLSLIVAAAEKTPDAPALIGRYSTGFKQLTFREMLKASRQLAQGFIEGNFCTESLYEGKKIRIVAMLLDNCLECFVIDFAAQYVPAVTVILNPRQEDTFAAGLNSFPYDTIVINARYSELLAGLMEQKKCRIIRNFVLTEDIPEALKERLTLLGVKTIAMAVLQANNGDAVTLPKVELSDPYTLLSTSGSTGQPKFVVGPNRLVVYMFSYGWGTSLSPGESFFFDLHYNYSSPRLIIAPFLANGNPVVVGKEIVEETLPYLKETNPSAAFWMPLFLAKIYEHARKFLTELPELEARKIEAAIEKKIAFVKETRQLHHPALDLELQEFRTQLFGTKLKVIYWSSNRLPEQLFLFFQAVSRCPILGLYGQMEVGGHVAIQEPLDDPTIIGHITPPYLVKLLSRPEIGYCVDDVIEGKQIPRGELMVKGPISLSFYNKDADFQKQFYEGGWFRTNDIMQLDLDTLTLHIIDRGNNVRRTLLGQFIPTADHERVYEQSSHVRQVCVYADVLSPSILAIVVPHEEPLRAIAIVKGIQGTLADLCRNELIQKAVLEDLRAVAIKGNIVVRQQVSGVVLSATPFSVENGLLTATWKFRREMIYTFYKDDIHAIRKRLESTVVT